MIHFTKEVENEDNELYWNQKYTTYKNRAISLFSKNIKTILR